VSTPRVYRHPEQIEALAAAGKYDTFLLYLRSFCTPLETIFIFLVISMTLPGGLGGKGGAALQRRCVQPSSDSLAEPDLLIQLKTVAVRDLPRLTVTKRVEMAVSAR